MKHIFCCFQMLCAVLACAPTFLSYTSSEQEDLSIEQFNNLDHYSFLNALAEREFSQNEINQLLFIALKRNSKELTERLIEKSADVNARDENGFTPLFTAAFNGAYPCAVALITQGAHLGSSDRWATIFTAIINLETKKVQTLLQGTNIRESEYFGFSLLHAAAYVEDVKIIEMLLKRGATLNRVDNDGNTPLHIALQQQDVLCIKSLIHHGADVNTTDEEDHLPLFYPLCALEGCTKSEQLEVLRILLAHGAHLDANINGMSPLHIAARIGRTDMIRCLIEAGANKDALDTKGFTPLIHAVKGNNLAVVRCLVTLGANINTPDRKGFTPLHHASQLESSGILDYLLDNNAHKDAQSTLNRTALDRALHTKRVATSIALLTHEGHFNQRVAEAKLLHAPDRFMRELLWGIHGYLSHADTSDTIKTYFHGLALKKLKQIGAARKKEWLKTSVGRAWHLVSNVTSPFYQNDYHHAADPLTEIKAAQTMLRADLPRDCVREIFEFIPLPWQTMRHQEEPEHRDQGTNTESGDEQDYKHVTPGNCQNSSLRSHDRPARDDNTEPPTKQQRLK